MKGKKKKNELFIINRKEEKRLIFIRWGDAPVHSIAAALLLKRNEIHFFNDIGYRHTDYTHCPMDPIYQQKCSCNPLINFGK